MADVRDEFGNPIQLTDERGNPVQLTDEFGNPMHLTGVAVHGGADVVSTETKVETKLGGPSAAVAALFSGGVGDTAHLGVGGVIGGTAAQHGVGGGLGGTTAEHGVGGGLGGTTAQDGVGGVRESERKKGVLGRSSSSSSSSSEDDGQGGRRKKKSIKERIKEKIGSGKHKEEHTAGYPTTVTSETRPGEHHMQHPTTVTSETRPGEHHTRQEHEKKSMMEKIKEKLPGHH